MVEAIFPKTLEHMGYFAVFPDRNLKRVTIQALKTFFDFVFWGGNSSLGYYVEEVRMLMTTPPVIYTYIMASLILEILRTSLIVSFCL